MSFVVLRSPSAGDQYLISADPDAHFGRGSSSWTHDVKRAMRFPTFDAALRYWQRQSNVMPVRPDGGINRPLTGYHMLLEEIEDGNVDGKAAQNTL